MKFQKFNCKTKEELDILLKENNASIPFSENIDILKSGIDIGSHHLNNRIAIQPMEGCDATFDGKPSDLTIRRYDRFSKSGASLIWMEAVSIVTEGKANPRQLFISENNIDCFKKLINQMKENCIKENGFEPQIICQLTHSGRYSKPNGYPEPLIAYNNPIFEKDSKIDESRILTDEYLKELELKFAKASALAEQCGFDGVDIKSCHRYLLSELCSAFTREGEYGGSFENRTRLLTNAIKYTNQATSNDFIVTTRLNVYDGFDYPYGFGVSKDGLNNFDLSEPVKLINKLNNELDVKLVNLSIGNPYVNSFLNRPADNEPDLPESPLVGVSRMFDCIKKVKEKFPGVTVVSSGHSYLQAFSGFLAAGAVENGISDIVGFGREAFAYPNFAKDMLNGELDPKKCCITCGNCSRMMRAGTVAGCIIRDKEVYAPYFKEYCLNGVKNGK